jgi:hypothetical protein
MKNICLHFAPWEGMPPQLQTVFVHLMGGDPQVAREFYRLYFYWFNIAHEMAHILRAECGMATDSAGQLWQEEQAANDFAVAYWRHHGYQGRLRRLGQHVEGALSRMDNPVPAGHSAEAFFNQNYAQLARNPQQYGFFQFTFVQAALSKRIDLYTVLQTLISPHAVPASLEQRLPHYELDEQLPAAVIDDLREYLKPCDVILPPVAVLPDAGPMIQYVEVDED